MVNIKRVSLCAALSKALYINYFTLLQQSPSMLGIISIPISWTLSELGLIYSSQ